MLGLLSIPAVPASRGVLGLCSIVREPSVDFALLGFFSVPESRGTLPFRSRPGVFFIASMAAFCGTANRGMLPLRSKPGLFFMASIKELCIWVRKHSTTCSRIASTNLELGLLSQSFGGGSSTGRSARLRIRRGARLRARRSALGSGSGCSRNDAASTRGTICHSQSQRRVQIRRGRGGHRRLSHDLHDFLGNIDDKITALSHECHHAGTIQTIKIERCKRADYASKALLIDPQVSIFFPQMGEWGDKHHG
jgi:hypothetical protein